MITNLRMELFEALQSLPHLVDEYEHDEGAHRGPYLGDHAAGEEVARVPAQPSHRHLVRIRIRP